MAKIECFLSYDTETKDVSLELEANEASFAETETAIKLFISRFQYRLDNRTRCPAYKESKENQDAR